MVWPLLVGWQRLIAGKGPFFYAGAFLCDAVLVRIGNPVLFMYVLCDFGYFFIILLVLLGIHGFSRGHPPATAQHNGHSGLCQPAEPASWDLHPWQFGSLPDHFWPFMLRRLVLAKPDHVLIPFLAKFESFPNHF